MFVVVSSSWRAVTRDPVIFAFAHRRRSSSRQCVSMSRKGVIRGRDPAVLFLLLSFAFMLSSWQGVSRDPEVFAFASAFSSALSAPSADALCLCFYPVHPLIL